MHRRYHRWVEDLRLAVEMPITYGEYLLRYTIGPFLWFYDQFVPREEDANGP